MKNVSTFARILIAGLSLTAGVSYGWGDRGHITVTEVAVELIRAHQGNDAPLTKLLVDKRSQLSYLSTVPDIVWRNQDRNVASQNAPTHFIDLDYLGDITAKTAPRDIASMRSMVSELCKKTPAQYTCPIKPGESSKPAEEVVGSAPLRIGQLFQLAVASLSTKTTSEGDRTQQIDHAVLFSGIMSHFIGDLANPMHTSKDYDGWEKKQGGLHSYFESDVVNAWNLTLQQEVFTRALKRGALRPYQDDKNFEPISASYAYAMESHTILAKLFKWDRTQALRKESSEERGMRIKAQRRNPDQVIKSTATRDLVADRLAAGAHELASMWLQAWRSAGSPNFNNYQSFKFHYTPELIPPPNQ